MPVKVEMKTEEGKVFLAFECSRPEEHEILDAVRTTLFGDFTKRGGYVNSNRFVVEVTLPKEEPTKGPA